MPNPFPGMNPYFENPVHWRTFHHGLIHSFQVEINRTLPRGFAVYVEDRIVIDEWKRDYYPDAMIVDTHPPRPQGIGNVAVLERPVTSAYDAPLLIDFTMMREPHLEIRDAGGELIAVIEFLSPSNKRDGTGREDYCRKQRDLLASSAHLMEIDLLRAGQYTVAPPEFGTREEAGDFGYVVSLHRGDTGSRFEVWTATVRDRLPRLRLPLTEEAGDVYPDLQAIVDRTYEETSCERFLDYRTEPVPPLSGEDMAWADALLREKGLR